MIVENEAAHAEAIRRAFEAAGADAEEIQVAGTLREYRASAAARAPDIAVMDLNLPDGRAVEVLTSPPESGPFPILIMTGCGTEQAAVEACKCQVLFLHLR
jgi:DNA-binding response OmpR family regulator